jgi:hypothetical protein
VFDLINQVQQLLIESIQLSTARKVTVSQYQGKTFLSIREFYEKDGKSLPGKKVSNEGIWQNRILT